MNSNKKNTIIIYGDYFEPLQDYDNEVLGALFRKILYYAKYKEVFKDNNDSEAVTALFKMFKHYIDIDIKKYEEKCKQNRANIMKRYNNDSIRP